MYQPNQRLTLENNPYFGQGLSAENWQRGYKGERFIGHKGSGAEAYYKEGRAARKREQPAPTVPAAWRDALRRSGATDHHGRIAFLPAQLEHFVSMLTAHQPAQEQAEPMRDCPECDGSGRISPSELCARCDHSGVLPAQAAQQEPVAAPQQAATLGSIGDFTEFHVLLNWYDNEASYGSLNEGRNKLTEYIDKWASQRAAQLDGGQEGSES